MPDADHPDASGPLEPDESAPVTGPGPVESPEGDTEAVLDLSESDAAIANAVALLSGPGLRRPEAVPEPAEVEATWGTTARAGLDALRDDLAGHRVGLAISGGGALGSFEAGVLRFLYDHGRIEPVAICGNSAGALNAAKLAEGDHDDGTAIDSVERTWRALRVNPDMWEPEPWLTRLMASASWAAAIRGHISGRASDAGSATSAVRVAARVVSTLARRPPAADGTFEALRDAVEAQSLLSLAPVADLVRRELHPDRVAGSGIKLRMGTVALESGDLRYVTETGHLHDRDDRRLDLPPVSLVDGILASASIPVAFPPVRLNDEHYVDGGAREILPLELLVQHLDVERVFAISAGTPTIERAGSFANRNLLDILRRVSVEIATNETLRKELSPPGGWHQGVRLVIPDIDVHDAMTIDPALIAISIDYGWLRASDHLLELGEAARALSTEITRTRISLRRAAGPLPSLFGADDPTPPDEPQDPTHWVDGVATLTARLREQVAARTRMGAPLPPSLHEWLATDPD